MSQFRYLCDRPFLVAVATYALNRWLLKPLARSSFLHDHFNDLLPIPAALPVVLWGQRFLGLHRHDLPSSWTEMGLHLVVWSLICEVIGPFWLHCGTADFLDVVAYTVGGIAVLALMYAFFRLATGLSATRLTSPAGFLEAPGFRLAGQRLANFGLVHSDLWQRGEEC